MYTTPSVFRNHKNIIAAESTRHGGVSPAPYTSLNLGLFTNDSPEHVAENRNRFFTALKVPTAQVASSFQTHGCEVLAVHQPGRFEGFDALITNRREIFLTVTIADCTPILVYDPVQHAVAAIHAGWRGTVGKIAEKTLLKLRETYGTSLADCLAYIGTCIGVDAFEVGDEVAAHFPEQHKGLNTTSGKYHIDLKAANYRQLIASGVRSEQITISPFSTSKDNRNYFSHRLEKGLTGRMLAGIGLK